MWWIVYIINPQLSPQSLQQLLGRRVLDFDEKLRSYVIGLKSPIGIGPIGIGPIGIGPIGIAPIGAIGIGPIGIGDAYNYGLAVHL